MEKQSALRLLVKSYENGLLDRQQYLKVRLQVLKKLSSNGKITQEDLKNFLDIYQDTAEQQNIFQSYSASDWIIIILGLLAAATLGIFLYK